MHILKLSRVAICAGAINLFGMGAADANDAVCTGELDANSYSATAQVSLASLSNVPPGDALIVPVPVQVDLNLCQDRGTLRLVHGSWAADHRHLEYQIFGEGTLTNDDSESVLVEDVIVFALDSKLDFTVTNLLLQRVDVVSGAPLRPSLILMRRSAQ
ncbi:MAG: hypothetical protein AAF557_02595 [Pseudomonadota bacterium]